MEGEVRAQGGVQRWVLGLSEADRAEYEQCRREEIDEWSDRIVVTLDEHIAEDGTISPESKRAVAEKISTALRDVFEQGMQMGMDDARRRIQPQLDRHHSIEIARLGGYG